MRSQREHFIRTVGLTDAERHAWMAIGVQGQAVPRRALADGASPRRRSRRRRIAALLAG
jgi:hypothetical protein